eukprot:scaffold83158_cov51-Phaeocystis_antarctica.AAC.1
MSKAVARDMHAALHVEHGRVRVQLPSYRQFASVHASTGVHSYAFASNGGRHVPSCTQTDHPLLAMRRTQLTAEEEARI